MFRTSICPSSGVQDTNLHTMHKTTHRLLRTTATTNNAEHHMKQHTTCTPEDGHIDLLFFWPCITNWLYINHQLLCTDYYLFI